MLSSLSPVLQSRTPLPGVQHIQGGSFLLSQASLERPSQPYPEVYLLADPRSCQVTTSRKQAEQKDLGRTSPEASASDLQPSACDKVMLTKGDTKAKVIGRSLCQPGQGGMGDRKQSSSRKGHL